MFDQFFVALFGFVHLFVASFGCDEAGDEVVVPFVPFVFIVTVVSIVTVVVSTRRHTPHRCMTILAIVVLCTLTCFQRSFSARLSAWRLHRHRHPRCELNSTKN